MRIASARSADLIRDRGLVGGAGIQLGLGDSYIARELAPCFDVFHVVEGSANLIEQHRDPEAGYEVLNSLFETFEPEIKYDVLLGNHVLEHVDEPVKILAAVRRWLKPGGRAVFTVPNADSLHRRIGVKMGMLEHCQELNSQDHFVGHRRVYRLEELVADVSAGGFKIKESFGYGVKLVSMKQMADWSDELLQAIYKVSLDLPPKLCSNIGVVCEVE